MELIFYSVIFIVIVTAFAGFIQTVFYPSKSIKRKDLPPIAQQELNSFPSFKPNSIKLRKPGHRYFLDGTIGDHQCSIKIYLTPDEDLAEIEFKDRSGPTAIRNKAKVPSTAVPLQVADVINPFLTGDNTEFESSRTWSGIIGAENAFEIKVRSENYEYEFEITESGRLVEFEKENINF